MPVPTDATLVTPRRDLFLALAVTYFAIPLLIFLIGWVRPAIGIPGSFIVAGGVAWFWWQKRIFTRPALTQKNLLLILTLAFLWTLLAGVGGALPQSSDYVKHNLLLHDLTSSSWPVKYAHGSGETYLCYALGYYLVPALGGCWLGADAMPAITFLWTAAGLTLFFWWAATLPLSPGKTLAAILLFAPTMIFWTLFKSHGLPGSISASDLDTKLLYGGLKFNGFDSFTRFNYQPQHALTGWLGAAVLYEMLWAQKNPRGSVFFWVLCVFWSPLSCLGLLLVPLAAWSRAGWQNYFEPINLIGGGVILAVLGIYFQGHLPLLDKGFIGTFLPGWEWVFFYAIFLLLLFLPLLFLWLIERKIQALGEWRPLFFCSIVVLLLLPLYKFGIYSDLRMQASAPALLFLALATVRIIQSEKFSLVRPLCLLLAAGLLIGAIFPVAHPIQKLITPAVDYSYDNLVRSLGWHSLLDTKMLTPAADQALANPIQTQNQSVPADATDLRFDVAAQYQGHGDSLAVRCLLKQTPGPNP